MMQVPSVTLEDLQAFQAAHFPGCHKPLIPPAAETAHEDNYNYDAEEDLGYYPDGVKRTLTDEQIRIFRHSEIHALLRARQLEEDDAEYEARRQVAEKDESEAENGPEDDAPGTANLKTAGSKRRRSTGRKPNPQQCSHDTPSEPLDYEESAQDSHKPHVKKPMAYPGRKIVSYAD
ncbi:uncharacterized protein N7498_000263 [Penicillium cinerascens]|uniref:Uncharacterized protein n=1 Tax=Penicillium cinerascens TaxID=70096 RepID=A0A9W9TD87_9EURO|nr:uncharacterized protein N7498_000263 [Penicillium cinerascens]KAJ5218164.1 hypothetical protein N7498_000263 [Penicillium cinerascens]